MPITAPLNRQQADARLRDSFVTEDFGDLEGEVEDYPFPGKKEFLRQSALSAWSERLTGNPINPFEPNWQGIKDGIAKGYFKDDTAENITDDDLFSRISADYQARESIADASIIAAARGESWLGRFREVETASAGKMPPGRQVDYLGIAHQVHKEVSEMSAPYRGIIKEFSANLSDEMDSAMPSTESFQNAADSLLSVPIKDRPMVIKLIGAAGGATPKERASYLSKLAGAMGRITETIGASVAGSMTEAAFSESATSLREAGNFGFAKDMEGEADKQGQYRILTQMIRQTADQEINPIKGDGWWGQLGIDVARMIPQTAITIANPAVGFGANLTYFQDTQSAQAMMEDPNLTYKQAQSITALSAPVSAAAETLTALIPFGKVKLPFLSKWTHAATTSTGGFLRKYGVRSAAGTATEIVEEYVQAAAPLVSQELLGVLSADMPDVDWESRMPDFSKIAEQTWAPALVFSLVGAGATSMMDVKNGRTLASDLDLMVATGIKPELAEKIKTASDAGNWSQVDGLFREDFTTPTDKKATAEERAQATTRLIERVRAMTAAEKVNWDSPDYTVSVTRGASGWRVETGDGQTIPVDSAEAARRIAVDLRQVGSQQEADALVGIIDNYHAKNAKAETVLTGEDVLGSNTSVTAIRDGKERPLDSNALETIRKEAENIGIQTGTEGIFAHVNGSNIVFANKIGKDAKEIIKILNLYQSQKGGQPQVVTFLHESIESNFELGLKTGAINEAEVRQAFAALAPALDPGRVRKGHDLERKLYENVRTLAAGGGDATMLRETFSELAVRDAFARDRSNKTAGSVGSISRAIEAAVMGAKTQEEATFLVRFRAMLKAFSTYLKGVLRTVGEIKRGRDKGLIGEEWDAFVDKVTGLDETKLLEHQAAEQAVKDVQAAGNMAFSVSAITPAQDSANMAEARTKAFDAFREARRTAEDNLEEDAGKVRAAVIFHQEDGDSFWSAFYRGRYNGLDYDPSGGFAIWFDETKRKWMSRGEDGFDSMPTEDDSFEGAKDWVKQQFVEDWENQQTDRTFGQWERGKDEAFNILDSFTPPPGIDSNQRKPWEGSGGLGPSGSIYGEFTLAGNENIGWKLRIADHENTSNLHKKPDKQFITAKHWSPESVESVMREAWDWLAKKSLAESSNIRFSVSAITPAQDSEYLAAVKAGDSGSDNLLQLLRNAPESKRRAVVDAWLQRNPKAAANMQRMVDEAAKAAGLTELFHGSSANEDVKTFEDRATSSGALAMGVYMSPDIETAQGYGKTGRYWVDVDLPGYAEYNAGLTLEQIAAGETTPVEGKSENGAWKIENGTVEIVVRKAAQIKSADPITRDADGNVIPLSQRFNAETPSFSVSAITPAQDTDYLAAVKAGDSGSDNLLQLLRNAPESKRRAVVDAWLQRNPKAAANMQRMVDEAAKAAGYGEKLKHGSRSSGYQTFDPGRNREEAFSNGKKPWFFAENEGTARTYGPNIADYRLKLDRPLEIHEVVGRDSDGEYQREAFMREDAYQALPEDIRELLEEAKDGDADTDSLVKEMLASGVAVGSYAKAFKKWGSSDNNGMIAYDTLDTMGPGARDNIHIVFDPSQIKSADPVTYDESGQVIPLSQRFNPESSDIRFSISPITNLEEVQEAIYQRMTQRPEEALRVWSNATRKIQKLIQRNRDGGWTWAGDRIRPISDKRTVKSLDKEQAMREATRESELIDEGLAALTPETMLAYSEGVGTLEDDPLIAKMLHDNGKLMSKSTAEREGKGIKDLYDDAPWIPPSWYSGGTTITTVIVSRADGSTESYDSRKVPDEVKAEISNGTATAVIKKHRTPATGGIMPDVMANNLGFDTASEMWAALESSIKSHRSAKEGYLKAEKAVRDVEKAAKEQAKEEAQAWRDEAEAMQAEDWNPREAMIRDLVAYEAVLSTMPKEIRGQLSGGFVALARKGSEAGRGKVIKKKVELMAKLLERHFKKKLFEKIESQFEKYGSEVGKAGQQESKLTTETSGDVDFARRFSNMPVTLPADSTEKSQDAVIGDLEKVIEESEDQDSVEAARDTLAIANLFYDMAKMDASELESAALWLDSTIAGGLEARKAIKEARKAYLDERRGRAKKDVLKGSPSSLVEAENAKAEIHSSGWKQFVSDVKGYVDSVIWTAAQQLEIIFGKKSQLTEEFHGRLVRAANQETDIKIEFEARRKIASEAIFGTGSTISQAGKMGKLQQSRKSGVIVELDAKTKTEKIESEIVESILNGEAEASEFGIDTMTMEALADQWADNQALPGNRRKKWLTWEKIESAGRPVEIEMSEADGIQYLLQSQQKQSREQMERDGWGKASFEQLEAFLSPEAKAWAMFLSAEYERAGKIVAPVFERIFQTPFPVVPDYVPMSRDVANVDGMAPLDGQTSKGGIEAGFTKSRNKKARAELKRVDAFLSYLAHIDHLSHWVSFVEVTRDMKAIFNDVSVQNAITTKGGQENGTALRTRIKALENKGLDDANSLHTINNIFTRLNTLRAFKGLAFRISPIFKQFSAWANPLLGDVPAWAYLRGHARLMAGKIDVSGMFKSADIQRRIEHGFSPEARIAQKRLGMTGSQMLAIMGKGMRGMTLADAGLTGIGAAISFDFYRSQNEKAGMSKPDAEFEARRQLEILIAETAQPADQVNRSLLESTKNPVVQALLMFISESRKVAAIELMAIRNLATGNSVNKAMDIQRIIVAHGVSTLMTQTMVGLLALLMGDDEDVEREWSVEQWASSFLAGPINGIFILGRGVQMGINRLFKLRTFQNTQPYEKIFDDVYNAGKNLGDLKDDDAEKMRKEYLRLLTATSAAIATVAGPANPVTALDVLSNAAKDVGDVMTRD